MFKPSILPHVIIPTIHFNHHDLPQILLNSEYSKGCVAEQEIIKLQMLFQIKRITTSHQLRHTALRSACMIFFTVQQECLSWVGRLVFFSPPSLARWRWFFTSLLQAYLLLWPDPQPSVQSGTPHHGEGCSIHWGNQQHREFKENHQKWLEEGNLHSAVFSPAELPRDGKSKLDRDSKPAKNSQDKISISFSKEEFLKYV
jgi:hypothetical protein